MIFCREVHSVLPAVLVCPPRSVMVNYPVPRPLPPSSWQPHTLLTGAVQTTTVAPHVSVCRQTWEMEEIKTFYLLPLYNYRPVLLKPESGFHLWFS